MCFGLWRRQTAGSAWEILSTIILPVTAAAPRRLCREFPTRAAIQSNHSQMVSEDACAGKLEGNPVREDIEEAGAICGIDYILNVVLDEHKHVIMAAAGDAVKAHREACRFLDRIYRKEIPERADIGPGFPGRSAQGSESVSDPEGSGQRQARGEKGRDRDPHRFLQGRIGRGRVRRLECCIPPALKAMIEEDPHGFPAGRP